MEGWKPSVSFFGCCSEYEHDSHIPLGYCSGKVLKINTDVLYQLGRGRGRVYNYKPVNHCLNQSSYCKIIIFLFKHQCMYMWILFSSQSFETGWENYDVQNRDSNWDPLNLWSGALTTEPSGASIQISWTIRFLILN